jgi:beta-phosphoglucomutase-like phosphatase (HAD superfamily)
MTELKAIIFDVDGTLAETEDAHLAAFNAAFAEEGIDWHWSESTYRGLLEIAGSRERMLHYARVHAHTHDHALQALIERLYRRKTALYRQIAARGEIELRPGALELIQEAAQAGTLLAIATTTSPDNISTLLESEMGPSWRSFFAAIGDASTAPLKKPDPQVYRQVVAKLAVPPASCIAVEDSSNGLRAATAAGIATVITPSRWSSGHDFSAAALVVPDLSELAVSDLNQLLQ